MTRLAEFAPYNPNAVASRLEEFEGKEVMVLDFRLVDGQYGEFAFMDIMPEDGKVVTVITGAKAVLEALKGAKAAMALPCPARFVRKGRKWIIE